VQGTFRYALLGQMISRWMRQMGGGSLTRIAVSYRGMDLEVTRSLRTGVSRAANGRRHSHRGLDIWVENLSENLRLADRPSWLWLMIRNTRDQR